jgi:hypothetical protein
VAGVERIASCYALRRVYGWFVAAALAAEPSVRGSIVWDAPAECPQATDVAARIERLLQRPLASDELELSGALAPVDDGWSLRLRLVVGGTPDERTLVAKDCAVLGDTAALVAAVLLDPVATTDAIDVAAIVGGAPELPAIAPAPELPVAAPIRRSETARPVSAPPRRRSRDRDVGVWLRARGGGELGAIPGGTGGFDIALAFGTRRLRGELAGSYWGGRPIARGASELRVHLGTIAPRICGVLPQRRIDITACGGGEIGVMRADVRAGGTRQPLWIALTAEVGVRWPVTPRVSLWLSAMPFVPLRVPEFRLVDPGDPDRTERVYRPSPVGIRGLAGVEIRLRGLDKPQ